MEDDAINGWGEMRYPTGEKFAGEWRDAQLIDSGDYTFFPTQVCAGFKLCNYLFSCCVFPLVMHLKLSFCPDGVCTLIPLCSAPTLPILTEDIF